MTVRILSDVLSHTNKLLDNLLVHIQADNEFLLGILREYWWFYVVFYSLSAIMLWRKKNDST